MTWLGDSTLAHLQDVAEWPDLGERYEITGRLGRGGMGAVFAAYDRVLNREVAVKVLDDLGHAAEAARLVNEAQILAHLEHPGIVPVHDAGTLPDGRVYYVMKLVRGERLDTAIQSRSLNERLDLFLRICEAVAFAHARGVVHRDLKPDNVMLGAFGEVLVMDWGLADYTDSLDYTEGISADYADYADYTDSTDSADSTDSTKPGRQRRLVGGTPGFMAPEQRLGAKRVDGRADVYSLGVILRGLIADPVPAPLAAIARRASAERPEERYDDVTELARDVVRFRDGDPVSAYRENLFERIARLYRRYQLPIVLVLAYIIMRLTLLLWRGV